MSEAEQTEASQQVTELTAELAEVRKKRDQLDAQNLRVTDNLRKAIEERDTAVKMTTAVQYQVASLQEQLRGMAALRAEYLAAKEAANANSDNAAALREQLQRDVQQWRAERDHAVAQWEECCEDRSRQVTALREQVAGMNVALNEMREQRNAMELSADQMRGLMDAARKASSEVQQQLVQMTAERDAAWAKVEIVITERDAAERERTESRAEVVQLQAERDAARKFTDDTQVQLSQWQVGHDFIKEQLAQAKEGADMFAAENTSLQDTVRQLRAKQIHDDLPGLLCAIRLAAEQAWELI